MRFKTWFQRRSSDSSTAVAQIFHLNSRSESRSLVDHGPHATIKAMRRLSIKIIRSLGLNASDYSKKEDPLSEIKSFIPSFSFISGLPFRSTSWESRLFTRSTSCTYSSKVFFRRFFFHFRKRCFHVGFEFNFLLIQIFALIWFRNSVHSISTTGEHPLFRRNLSIEIRFKLAL